MSRCQPSTMTKSRILNGSDIIVGGTMKEQVHLCNGSIGHILFLTKDFSAAKI